MTPQEMWNAYKQINPSIGDEIDAWAFGVAPDLLADSEFWVNVLMKWAPAWEKNGWKKKNGEIKNLDIVKPLFELYKNSKVKLKWLKGHAGHEFNEMADEWANRARNGETI